MPISSAVGRGPVPPWVGVTGWAAAAQRKLGQAWILTPQGVLSPEEARELAARPAPGRPARRGWRRHVPRVAGTAYMDGRQAMRAQRFRSAGLHGPWMSSQLVFVWQRHELFQWAGFEVARALKVPLVLFVAAALVWEHRKWGIRRPGWGRLVEFVGERPQFRSADLVACGSEEVREVVRRVGVPDERLIVTPNGVDLDLFSPNFSDQSLRESLGLKGKFVVGWVGSFRPFHGVEMILHAADLLRESIPDLAVLLVGDGPERQRMTQLAGELGMSNVVFTGTVPHREIVRLIAAMDVAVIVDPGTHEFHYSPLKLREYMASGKAVVAPRVGEMQRELVDGAEAILVERGDAGSVAQAIEKLNRDYGLRRNLGAAARARVVREGSWDSRIEQVLAALKRLSTLPQPAGRRG